MINKRLNYDERPTVQAVGNNSNRKFVQWIAEYLSMAGGRANTLDIYYWLNENTKNGQTMPSLVNILSKGPFTSVGEERTKNGLGQWRMVKIWQVKVDKVEERSDNNE